MIYCRLIIPLFLLVQTSTFTQVEALRCYACPVQSKVDGCTHVSTCAPGKMCMLRRNVDPSTQAVSYQTLCKDTNECFAEINKYQTIIGSLIGRKREMHQVVSDNGECLLQCCDDDTCNAGCLGGPSTVATTTKSNLPHFNIPTPPPHINLTTAIPTTTKVIMIPTTPKPTTTIPTTPTTTTPTTTTVPTTTPTTTTVPTTTPTTTTVPTTTPTTTTVPTTTPTTTTKSSTTKPTPTTTTATTTQKPIACAHVNYLFENSCYIIPRQEMSFRDAQRFCASHNARLVHVRSAKENDFLKQTMRDKRQPIQYWIGITDETKENEWLYYDDHSLASFFDWMPGEPDGKQIFDGTSEADCAVFDPFADFQWRDEECSPYQYSVPICEIRIPSGSITSQVVSQTPSPVTSVPSAASIAPFRGISSTNLMSTTRTLSTQFSNLTTNLTQTTSRGIASTSKVNRTTSSGTTSSLPTSSSVAASSLATSSSAVDSSLATSSSVAASSLITSSSVAASSMALPALISIMITKGIHLITNSSIVPTTLSLMPDASSLAPHTTLFSRYPNYNVPGASISNHTPVPSVSSNPISTASSTSTIDSTTILSPSTTNYNVSGASTSNNTQVPAVSSVSISTGATPSTNTSIVKPPTTLMPSTTKRVCPTGALEFGDSCYLFVKLEMSFRKAKEFCTNHNAHLVHVDSTKENDYLKQKMKEINNPVQYWIGIMDDVAEDVWTFYDNGQNATYFDWGPGEPDGRQGFDGSNNADCAVFDPFMEFQWKDEECSPYHYSQTICEL